MRRKHSRHGALRGKPHVVVAGGCGSGWCAVGCEKRHLRRHCSQCECSVRLRDTEGMIWLFAWFVFLRLARSGIRGACGVDTADAMAIVVRMATSPLDSTDYACRRRRWCAFLDPAQPYCVVSIMRWFVAGVSRGALLAADDAAVRSADGVSPTHAPQHGVRASRYQARELLRGKPFVRSTYSYLSFKRLLYVQKLRRSASNAQ